MLIMVFCFKMRFFSSDCPIICNYHRNTATNQMPRTFIEFSKHQLKPFVLIIIRIDVITSFDWSKCNIRQQLLGIDVELSLKREHGDGDFSNLCGNAFLHSKLMSNWNIAIR